MSGRMIDLEETATHTGEQMNLFLNLECMLMFQCGCMIQQKKQKTLCCYGDKELKEKLA